MKGSLRKSFFVYTFSNLLSTALPFLLLPFLTTVLSTSDYGVLSNFTGLCALVLPVITINFTSAYSRQYFKESIDIKRYVGAGISLQFLLSIINSILFFVFEDFIFSKTGIDLFFIRLIGIYSFVFGLSEIVLTMWRLEEKVWHFGLYRILRTVIELALTFVFILGLGMDYHGRVNGILFASVIGVIPVLVVLSKKGYVHLQMNRSDLAHMLKYGLPLIPHALGATILVYSDKMIITNEIGLSANGLYSVAFQVAMIIGLIQNSFNQAWVPWFYKAIGNPSDQIKRKIIKITYLYYIGLAVLTIALIFGTPLIFMFLGKEFTEGSGLVAWIAVGFFFNGMYKMVVNYLFYMEKTVLIGSITLVSAVVNIILNIVLIDKYGLQGAAMATAVTFLFQLVFVWYFAQRSYPMPWLLRTEKNDSEDEK